MIKIMRPSLLSRPRNVAERFPCPDPAKPRAVWAIPGFDVTCGVAKPRGWVRPIIPPSPKLTIGSGSRCRNAGGLSPESAPIRIALEKAIFAGHPCVGAGWPAVSRPDSLCLQRIAPSLPSRGRGRRRRPRARAA